MPVSELHPLLVPVSALHPLLAIDTDIVSDAAVLVLLGRSAASRLIS